MRNIVVITGNRAEYGVLKNIIQRIKYDEELNLQLIVTGTHLSPKYGNTIDEIKQDGFNIDFEIPIIDENSNGNSTAIEMGRLMIKCDEAFKKLKPDIVLVSADRYEMFAATTTAMANNIPIAHISGGEITEGAMDEQIRHAITKMAHIHFPGAKYYAENIKNMGEEEWRIFNVGDPGIENIKSKKMLNCKEIEKKIGVVVKEDTILVTFHPVTLEAERTEEYIDNLISALANTESNIIITYPNSDNGGEIIIQKILEFQKKCNRVRVFSNLGSLLYLSVMKNCGLVMGNSSSGIIEAPFLKKAVINIGNRQKGRLMSKNIINCGYSFEEISNAINKANSRKFKAFVKENCISLYGDGNTSDKIVKVLKKIEIGENLLKKKLVWEK